MRADDMTIGDAYALAGPRAIKVTLLPTPPEVRAQRRVRVRFETGVMTGPVTDLPSRRIAAACYGPAPSKPPRARRSDAVVAVARAPRVGDTVLLPDTGDLEWTVEDIEHARGELTVGTTMFGRPVTRAGPIDTAE